MVVDRSALIIPPSSQEQRESLPPAFVHPSKEGIITERKRTTSFWYSLTSNPAISYCLSSFALCTKFIQLLQGIYFHVYTSLPIQLRLFGFSYRITNNLTSSATRIMFIDKGSSKVDVCLKIWQDCDNELYYTKESNICAKYLLEGWKFNRCFAKDVYIGIAPVKSVSESYIYCGRLLWFPTWHSARIEQSNQQYALVMRYLEQHFRLDHQLLYEEMETKKAMAFLANSIAQMHQKLKPSYDKSGTLQGILDKLELNKRQFEIALNQLSLSQQSFNKNKYAAINAIITSAYKKCSSYFEQRYQQGEIRRCHGDLKATNLWIRQKKNGEQELMAIDCVDFKPEFCHIDILSDVAMLAIDLEMRLTHHLEKSGDIRTGKKLANCFLYMYLEAMQTKGDDVKLLLEYYMTEKAMICAFMSILYDQLPTLGIRYMDVALLHARKLERKLTHPDKIDTSFQMKPFYIVK